MVSCSKLPRRDSTMAGISSRVKGQKEWASHDLEDKPLTVVCHQGNIDIKPDNDCLQLTPEYTKYHGYKVDRIDPDAVGWIEHILGYSLVDKEDRADSDAHIIGLCDLSIKFMKMGYGKFFVKEPETHLHPSQQVRIADFFVHMSKASGVPVDQCSFVKPVGLVS